MIDKSFQAVHRTFDLSFENDTREVNREFFLLKVEINYYYVMINFQHFSDQSVKMM